jgi:hypothetical protein
MLLTSDAEQAASRRPVLRCTAQAKAGLWISRRRFAVADAIGRRRSLCEIPIWMRYPRRGTSLIHSPVVAKCAS